MRTFFAILIAIGIVGCATKPEYTEIRSLYTDHSDPGVTNPQAVGIGKREAIAREGFVDEPRVPNTTTKLVACTAKRINNGGWRVIARPMVCTNDLDGSSLYLDVPAAVITIDSRGEVIGYTRHTMQEIKEAEGGDGDAEEAV